MLFWYRCNTRIESKPFRDPTHLYITCSQRQNLLLLTRKDQNIP